MLHSLLNNPDVERMPGSIAEFETDLRRERQMEGIAKTKSLGKYQGRPVTIDDNPSIIA